MLLKRSTYESFFLTTYDADRDSISAQYLGSFLWHWSKCELLQGAQIFTILTHNDYTPRKFWNLSSLWYDLDMLVKIACFPSKEKVMINWNFSGGWNIHLSKTLLNIFRNVLSQLTYNWQTLPTTTFCSCEPKYLWAGSGARLLKGFFFLLFLHDKEEIYLWKLLVSRSGCAVTIIDNCCTYILDLCKGHRKRNLFSS